MWPFKSKIVGHEVNINLTNVPADTRLKRANNRVFNLTNKLERLKQRKSTLEVKQEIANTEIAIQSWTDVRELTELELMQQKRREGVE
jgi:hypothetical protein